MRILIPTVFLLVTTGCQQLFTPTYPVRRCRTNGVECALRKWSDQFDTGPSTAKYSIYCHLPPDKCAIPLNQINREARP